MKITMTMIMAATMTMIVMKTKRACKPGFPKKVDEMGGVIRMGAFAKHLLNSQNLLPFYPDLPNLQLRPSLGLLYLFTAAHPGLHNDTFVSAWPFPKCGLDCIYVMRNELVNPGQLL